MSDRSCVPVARRPATAPGFTLIELMVALAILGILVGIAYPAYLDSVRKSRRGQAKADLLELAQRAERFHTQGNSYVGFGASLSAADRQSPRTGAAAYTLRVSDETANGYTLRAEPSGAQANDTACAGLSLNQAGVKGSTGSAGAAHCW
ncbi:MAG: type IV pilin protein [Lysobacter sp.]|nr:type IV pilin protein [Lysobacter sp.]